MSKLSLSEIVYGVCKIHARKDKIEFLRQNNSLQLRDILKIMYDKNLKLLIPSEAPPYNQSPMPDSHGKLYSECRKLKHFVEGYSGNLNNIRREKIFIEMLESVDKDDALLLIDMIKQKPLKGLTASVINEAFGFELVPENNKEKKEEENV